MANKRTAIASIATAGAVALVAGFEGFRSAAYLPHKDDVPTIGYGQTFYTDGRKVKMGDRISEEVARTQLNDLIKRDFVLKMAACVKVPLNEGEFKAFVSLAYNIGAGAFCRSTLVRKLNAGDYVGACREILRWNRSGGRVLSGLQRRRLKEYEICLKGE